MATGIAIAELKLRTIVHFESTRRKRKAENILKIVLFFPSFQGPLSVDSIIYKQISQEGGTCQGQAHKGQEKQRRSY